MSDHPAPGVKDTARKAGQAAGRTSHAFRAGEHVVRQMPWRIPLNHDRPTDPLGDEGVAAIHDGAMRILSDIGIRFLNEEALALLRQAGCKVEGQAVFMGEDFVMAMVARCPVEFTITPRNPDRALPVGGRHILFGSVSSPPNYWDIRRGKVPGFMDGFRDLVKLTQHFNCIHFAGGYPVEPVDVHPSVRHLECLYEKLVLTDKAIHAYALGRERVEDAMEMVRIAGGLSHDEFRARPRMFANINSVSPLKHDHTMIDGALRFARAGQVVIVTPVTLAGAMAPVTLAGAVTLAVAEALAAIALIQFAAPGAPCMIGTFTSNVDMKSGAPAFGTPEYMRATQMAGQMARFYKLPLRASGACSANVPDGQSMWETSNSLWSAVQSGAHMIFHAAGWLEGGLVASPEKFVMDCEVLQMIQRYMEPATWATTPGDLAIDTIAAVGPDGHYLGCRHTLDRQATAFHVPFASDLRSYDAWQADGGLWTAERAHRIASAILADFTPPPIDPGIDEELRAFVARRKAEGGAPADF